MTTAKITITVLPLLALLAGSAPAPAQQNQIPGHAIMALSTGVTPDSVLAEIDAEVIDSIPGAQIFLISFPEIVPVQTIVDSLSYRSGVLFAEPNFRAGLRETYQVSISFPDENAPAFEPGYSPAAFYDQTGASTVGVDSAQLLSVGEGVRVAVIDAGVDFTHPLLDYATLMPGYDFVDDDADPTDDSGRVYGHGTFVSGLIALIAPDCQLIPIRVFDGDGHGNGFSLAKAIHYSIGEGADIVHFSFGMYDSSQTLHEACSVAVAAGLILVASSGNDAFDIPTYPAALAGVIAVSTIDTLDLLANFSNFGDYIDVCAPGVSLYSALAGEYDWGTWDGTPFAASLVSATCALISALDTVFSATEMEAHIRATATRELLWGTVTPPDIYYGYGRLNAGKAVWTVDSVPPPRCGDANGDEKVDVGDAVFLVNYIFRDGPAPDPVEIGDANCDWQVNLADAVCLVNFVFKHGPEPCCL